MNLNENIQFYRKQKKMSQRELGRRINKTGQLISLIEQGKTTPSVDTIEKISAVLEIPVMRLMSNAEPTNDEKFIGSQNDDVSKYLSEEDLKFLAAEGYIKNNKLIPGAILDLSRRQLIYKNRETLMLPVSMDEIKKKVDKIWPLLQPEVEFLTNPIVEKVFNYSYNDLASKGYEELLFRSIEKAISNTLNEINEHIENGDYYDGLGTWIIKDSPLYEKIKEFIK